MSNLGGFPSRNQSADDSLIGLLSLFRAKMLQNLDDMLPARVIAYNRATNRAQVQPLIVMVDTLGRQVPRAQIASIPVLQMGGGGFVISFPLKTGDLGWIKANDRDISLFKKSYASAAPNTQRKHSFEDALFVPDSFMKNVVVAGEDAENLVIQNLSGTVRVSLFSDKVKITAPAVEINTPAVTCTGDLTVDCTITSHTDVLAQTVSLHNHTHPGVQSGPSNTGAPNP